jgi:hypothetical protein
MQLQKRWPIVFAVGSVVAYLGNHYTIDGIEHLRLQPRKQANPPNVNSNLQGNDFGFDYSSNNSLPSTSPSWQNADPAAALINSAIKTLDSNATDWSNKLGVGEKLAVMQEQLSQRFTDIAARSDSQFPATAPIPVPGGLSRSTMAFGELPTTSPAAPKPVSTAVPPLNSPSSMNSLPAIRLASFNLYTLGAAQLAKPQVAEALHSILRQFDIIAVQGVQSERDDILPILVERLNQSGRRFDYLIGPRVGQAPQFQQFAFLFDSLRIETDRYQLYTIDDPENLITFEPLVGWFRCKEAKQEESFTFSLINVRINRATAAAEQAFVPNLFHAVANDGRKEDDLIVVGDFSGNPGRIEKLNSDSVRFAFRDIPTDVSGSSMNDCILFSAKGTTEFTGKAGVYDFLRKHNLSLEQALEISPNLPVWAEFYIVEGAHPGRVAPTNSQQLFQ